MIGRIREHLARGEYIAVKALAQGVIINPDSPAEEKAVAALLAVQAAMCLGEGLVACAYAARSLGYAQESGRSDLEGRSLFWLGTAKLGVGDHAEARTFLEQYLAGLSQRWSELDGELTGHAYINLGKPGRLPPSNRVASDPGQRP